MPLTNFGNKNGVMKNKEVFGKCANPNWHGHNYTVYITVKGIPDPETGFVTDLKELSRIVRIRIVDELDHKNLNLDVPFMSGKMASTEILTIEIWNQLKPEIEELGCMLHSVRVAETENNSAEYFGE